jgi:uncharacterized DUF497 family protein
VILAQGSAAASTLDSVYDHRILECREEKAIADWADAEGFDWDDGNAEKNWLRHRVSQAESEQVFFNRPLVIAEDDLHSHGEPRSFALGRTDASRLLFVVYTLRAERVRIISARDMTRRERKEYDHARAQELEADPEV